VDLILSALDAAQPKPSNGSGPLTDVDRRLSGRMPYRVRGELRLFSDSESAEPWVLFTRDVDVRGCGFITPHRLPLGYGGCVELFTPRGTKVKVECTILRCREAAPGWYEGGLSFNREQWVFQVD
jgi:hypothetical protein